MSRPRALADHPNTRGTAAVADVTTSQTDTTAGRLLKVGDFGVGSNAPPAFSGDLNTITQSGFYRIDGDATNNPGSASLTGTLWVQVRIADPARITQLWITAANAEAVDGQIYIRAARGVDATPVWSPWRKVYDTENILGSVSQVSGVPTGAIIERSVGGSNGDYVRFADGTMICTHTIANASTGSTTTWTFPSVFFQASGLNVQALSASSATQVSAVLVTLSTTSVGLDARDTSNTRTNAPLRVVAIGRWY
jgi:hypothetical protein